MEELTQVIKECEVFLEECEKIERDNKEFFESYGHFFGNCTAFFKDQEEEFEKYC